MPQHKSKTVAQVVRELGRYPREAFELLYAGLDYTVRKMHGPASDSLIEVHKWLDANGVDPAELVQWLSRGAIPPPLAGRIGELGGPESAIRMLNRHVSGADLCFGLRDVALERWGLLASTVLRRWRVTSTMDFGRIVFALVDAGLLQRQANDAIEDFEDVFDFAAAFDGAFRICIADSQRKKEPA